MEETYQKKGKDVENKWWPAQLENELPQGGKKEFWYGRPKTDPGPKNDPELFDRGIFLGADPSHAGSRQVLTRSTNGYFTFYSKQGWLGPLRGPRLPR